MNIKKLFKISKEKSILLVAFFIICWILGTSYTYIPILKNNIVLSQIKSLLFSVVCTSVLWIADYKFGFLENFYNRILEKFNLISKKHLFFTLIYLVILILSIMCCKEKPSLYYCIYVWGIIGVISVLIFGRKFLKERSEIVCISLILIIGLTMILVKPFGHISWDTESHYKYTLSQSYLCKNIPVTQSDSLIVYNSEDFFTIEGGYDTNHEKILSMNDSDNKYVGSYIGKFSIAHLPAGIMLAILRLFQISFYWKYTLGCLPNLIIYALCTYFGMKRIHSGKMIYAVIAMFPTNIFLACNYSYDYWVNCFMMLGMAYFVSYLQEKKKDISLKDNVIMCVAFLLAIIPKLIYLPILIIPAYVNARKIKNKKLLYTLCAVLFALMCLAFMYITYTKVLGGGDLRGGSGINSAAQIKFILKNPMTYTAILLKFLSTYLSVGNMYGYISFWAYLGIGNLTIIIQILLLVVILTDKNEYDVGAYRWYHRLGGLAFYIGFAVLCATALYIVFTAVGSNEISGCQTRYMLPAIYVASSMIAGKGIIGLNKYRIFSGISLGIMSSVSMIYIYQMMIVTLVS